MKSKERDKPLEVYTLVIIGEPVGLTCRGVVIGITNFVVRLLCIITLYYGEIPFLRSINALL